MERPEDTLAIRPFSLCPPQTAVFLDLDGTLAPIVPRPEDVSIPHAIAELVRRVADRFGLVAIISGRRLAELVQIVALPGVAYSGNHGYEIQLVDGTLLPGPDIAIFQAFLADVELPRLEGLGVWLEDKGATLTFHYRNAPDRDLARRELDQVVGPLAAAAGLDVEPGRMSLEIHPDRITTKGTAARTLLEHHPEVRRVISLGDDRTDVEVWKTLRDLQASGVLDHTLGVAIASDESPDILLHSCDLTVVGLEGTRSVLAALVDQPG